MSISISVYPELDPDCLTANLPIPVVAKVGTKWSWLTIDEVTIFGTSTDELRDLLDRARNALDVADTARTK